jgi:hypothetical protein
MRSLATQLSITGWIGRFESSLTLILFALPISALWNSGISDGFIIGGLLPTGDAGGYYWEARRCLNLATCQHGVVGDLCFLECWQPYLD